MATSSTEGQPRGSVDFVESSVLEAVVPSASDFDIEDELASWDGSIDDENSSVLPFIPQRQMLIFDELVDVYVVFRTPLIDDVTLKAYLSRLTITLETFAFSSAPAPEPEAKAVPPKELMISEAIKESNTPTIIRYEEDDHSHIYVVWKLEVAVCRPRGRYHKPAIYFQPTASLKPAERTKRHVMNDDYLPSRVPTALNLLQSFEHDPALAGIHPRLSALRISKIAPTAPVARELARPIRTGQRRLFRALPILIWRVRYSKIQTALSDMSLMASLDLEVAHITGCNINVEEIKLELGAGQVKNIGNHDNASIAYKPGDQLTYLYKLTPDRAPDGTPIFGSEGHPLMLSIKTKALVSDECQPTVFIEWRTGVDFTAEQNANLVRAAHRLSNPTSQPKKAQNPDSLPSHDQSQQTDAESNKAINVTLTISGPPTVQVGDIFHWHIFIVNRSDKARKLAVLVLPKRKREYERHKSQTSASSAGAPRKGNRDLLASAVVDENIVYAKQKNGRSDAAELVCLTTDVRIGHLAPGACYTAEIRFVALSSGVLGVEAVRLVDLATQETSDIRDLPTIVAIEKE
ncbi:TRAPP trafficking subunit Trs65-domain-containing protein [Massariosphaeria phaeospora]|uniref:TRAPP trafficking subunit Trs65-domain-containing protein n=1 Tax=Massariosphaeria phaeospora TaxID=100035 RepID=A0A7C8M2H9_9PLEO|nr:TRAPP trafficking subunit Trs65-domain-containing protein [Massariosphaeria phaeospora]